MDKKKSYSASELVNMRLPYLPTTKKGWLDLVEREKWGFVMAPGGRGCKGGLRREYYPSETVAALIESMQKQKTISSAQNYPQSQATPIISGSGIHDGFKVNDHSHQDEPDNIFIEHYVDVRGAAGAGQVTPTDQLIISVAVNASEWRSYVGLNPKYIKVINVYGDSMRPTLQHGDQVLVDTACNTFMDDAIYAIQQADVLRIKRIKLKLDGSIEVKSDNNHNFDSEVYSKEEAAAFIVFGRVLPFKFGKFDL